MSHSTTARWVSSSTRAIHVAACIDLRVPFKVIDILANDWIERLEDNNCSGFLATPPALLNEWRRLYEERLWVVFHDLGKVLCPSFQGLYLWENKRRMHDWLIAHKVPHPETWVFVDRDRALGFVDVSEYPLVCKTNSGAASSGVFILQSRRDARRLVKHAFSKGILPRSTDFRDREVGSILFQEFVPHDYEWRIVRVGDDFMCRRKVRAGDFASGSGNIGWAEPLQGMLDFAKHVTDIGGFKTMSLDIFENKTLHHQSPFLVNELQAIIGFRDVPETGHMGRWVCDGNSVWHFEHGRFHDNALANLRVQVLLKELGLGR